MRSYVQKYKWEFLFFLGGLLCFTLFLGKVRLFDWDEINFAESAREMILTGNYFQVQINFEPFMEKPPFFMWLQVLSMKLFGINEFSARLPNAVTGASTLLVLFKIGKFLKSERFGIIWTFIYGASVLPHLYYKSGIIDPVFNFFIFSGIYFLVRSLGEKDLNSRRNFNVLSGGLIGLAVITKGPVGLLLPLLTFVVFFVVKKGNVGHRAKDYLLFVLSFIFVTLFWYGYETWNRGPWFLVEFFKYQIELFSEPVAGHEQPFYYHFVVVLVGCFPMSIIGIPKLVGKIENDTFHFGKWMQLLFWVVLLLFSIVTTKIVHYSSMTYLPLSYLAALQLWEWHRSFAIKQKYLLILMACFGFVFSAILTMIPILGMYKEDLLSPLLIHDKFAQAAAQVEVEWLGWEFLIGLFYASGVLLFIYSVLRNNIIRAVKVAGVSTAVSLCLYGCFVLPKIEAFSQGSALDFLEKLKNRDCYIATVDYKSYAPFFYAESLPLTVKDKLRDVKRDLVKAYGKNFNDMTQREKNWFNADVVKWLKEGNVDKPAYFLARIDRDHGLHNHENCKFLYAKGGFEFFVRYPPVPGK